MIIDKLHSWVFSLTIFKKLTSSLNGKYWNFPFSSKINLYGGPFIDSESSPDLLSNNNSYSARIAAMSLSSKSKFMGLYPSKLSVGANSELPWWNLGGRSTKFG